MIDDTNPNDDESATGTQTDPRVGPILVPNRVLEDDAIEPGVIALLSNASVVLLGYHELPEQTPPGQARLQFEDRALERLEDLADALEERGATVETRLVFTHDRERSLNRIAEETACAATLIPNPAMELDRVLVPLRGERSLKRVVGLTGSLLTGTDVSVTLYHLDSGEGPNEDLLDRGREILKDRGVAPESIDVRIESSRTPVRTIVSTAAEYDAVVMGESDPSVTTFVFGETAAEVGEQFHGPVLIVRRRGEEGPPDEPIVPAESGGSDSEE